MRESRHIVDKHFVKEFLSRLPDQASPHGRLHQPSSLHCSSLQPSCLERRRWPEERFSHGGQEAVFTIAQYPCGSSITTSSWLTNLLPVSKPHTCGSPPAIRSSSLNLQLTSHALPHPLCTNAGLEQLSPDWFLLADPVYPRTCLPTSPLVLTHFSFNPVSLRCSWNSDPLPDPDIVSAGSPGSDLLPWVASATECIVLLLGPVLSAATRSILCISITVQNK